MSKKTGDLLLCDINNKRVQVLNEKGDFLHQRNTEVNGSRLCPLDVTRYDENTILLAMEGYATLWRYPDVEEIKEAKIIEAFGNQDLVFPRSIIRNELGQILVSDVGRHCVNMYDTNGVLIKTIGSVGKDDATNFNWPYYMCLDDRGRLAVADSHNCCVKLFDSKSLKYLGQFGKEKFTCACGLTYDGTGNGCFYVCDYDNRQLMNFASDGQFIEYIDQQMPIAGAAVDIIRPQEFVITVFDGYIKYKKSSK